MSPAELRPLVDTRHVATEIIVLDEATSTNDYAIRCGEQGKAGGLVVFAEHQTHGRGRLGRRWDSQPGQGLWFSILLRPTLAPAKWPRYASTAALGVALGVEKILATTAGIKWPNDVHLDGRKVAGILLESRVGNDSGFLVLGIGINVNQAAFPDELSAIATSLRLADGIDHDRTAVAATVLTELDTVIDMTGDRFDEVVAECARRSTLLGRTVTLDTGERQVTGHAESLDADGQLVLRCADGTRFAAGYGEVSVAKARRRSVELDKDPDAGCSWADIKRNLGR